MDEQLIQNVLRKNKKLKEKVRGLKEILIYNLIKSKSCKSRSEALKEISKSLEMNKKGKEDG